MKIEEFVDVLDSDFFVGVPDSQLRALCDYLMDEYGLNPEHHIIGVNEGNCVGIAAGYYLATQKVPVVYMQNSGQGNAMNPIASLLNEKVYGIPCIFVIGWRGEPGIHDEPQHVFQGEITLKYLDVMNIEYMVIDNNTTKEELATWYVENKDRLESGHQLAFVIKKNSLVNDVKFNYKNNNLLIREEVIEAITRYSGEDIIVSTTGKASRELFEIREKNGESHKYDFLTVGSMGHSSAIALGMALQKPEKRIWIIDGDGAMLMHLGAMTTIGSIAPNNIVHIVINNGAHETVGGMNTVADKIDICKIAEACGYQSIRRVASKESLVSVLEEISSKRELSLVEIMCSVGSRKDLGRPTNTPAFNKEMLMEWLNQ